MLDDPTQFWMKKTTDLANDLHRRAHAHESLASKRAHHSKNLDEAVEEDKKKNKNPEEVRTDWQCYLHRCHHGPPPQPPAPPPPPTT